MPASATTTTAKRCNNKKTTTTTSVLEAYLLHKRTQRLLLKVKPTPGKVLRDRALARGLRGIRAKYAPRAAELAKAALDNIERLRDLETEMDNDARALHPEFEAALPTVKLTFEATCDQDVDDTASTEPTLEDAEFVLKHMLKEAKALSTRIARRLEARSASRGVTTRLQQQQQQAAAAVA